MTLIIGELFGILFVHFVVKQLLFCLKNKILLWDGKEVEWGTIDHMLVNEAVARSIIKPIMNHNYFVFFIS